MPVKTIELVFEGYWREKDFGGIPNKSGIYVVYEASYNFNNNKVSLHKLIYIGESTDVNDRIDKHEKWPLWKRECASNKELCFSFAPVINPDRERGESALIYKHKPPVNTEYKNNFPFDQTTMKLSGEIALLETLFTVYRKD